MTRVRPRVGGSSSVVKEDIDRKDLTLSPVTDRRGGGFQWAGLHANVSKSCLFIGGYSVANGNGCRWQPLPVMSKRNCKVFECVCVMAGGPFVISFSTREGVGETVITQSCFHSNAAVTCPPLPVPVYGLSHPSYCQNSTYTMTCWFSCHSGYQLSGHGLLTCQEDGTWSDLPPNCQRESISV